MKKQTLFLLLIIALLIGLGFASTQIAEYAVQRERAAESRVVELQKKLAEVPVPATIPVASVPPTESGDVFDASAPRTERIREGLYWTMLDWKTFIVNSASGTAFAVDPVHEENLYTNYTTSTF